MNPVTHTLRVIYLSVHPEPPVTCPTEQAVLPFLLELGLVATGHGYTCITPRGIALLRAGTLQ